MNFEVSQFSGVKSYVTMFPTIKSNEIVAFIQCRSKFNLLRYGPNVSNHGTWTEAEKTEYLKQLQ